MKHYFSIALSAVIIAAFISFILDSVLLNNDTRVGIGILTITGWLSLILFSAYNCTELRRTE